MRATRTAGILLHPTSLAGNFGIGDLGPAAFEMCDGFAKAGQTYWQVLPLGPTGYGDSPYQSLSAFAGNTLLISPEKLIGDGLLTEADVANAPSFDPQRVDFAAVRDWKENLLRVAFARLESGGDLHDNFARFCHEERSWLNGYALYRAIKSASGESAWFDWPEEIRRRDADAIQRMREDLESEVRYGQFCQYIFFKQWRELREYAGTLGLDIIGDIPIFVALDSCDVWVRQPQFKLDEDGSPRVVAGVPPDYFSKTGQLWGNPICDWDAMRDDGFSWWVERFRHALRMVDVVRIDHFRGFVSTWEVPGRDETAQNGQWVEVPGRELFARLRDQLGELPAIAEDLGAITPEVNALRDEFGFPGMRILEYAFGGDARNHDLPHNYVPETVAYTGTHDNDTAAGWFASLDDSTREHALQYLDSDGADITWDMIRALYASVAETVITPMQDVLALGVDARMNTPATTAGNWQWRMQPGAFSDQIIEHLRGLVQLYGRA